MRDRHIRRDPFTIPNYVLVRRGGGPHGQNSSRKDPGPDTLGADQPHGRPKHGYALIQVIEGMSGVALGPGTLYGVLARLEEEGLVEALPEEDRRRPYRLTSLGAATLRERLETMS